MRLSLSVAAIAIGAAVATANPALTEVKTVYLLPMSNSLDQYLANMLTRSGLLQVVTDPQKADAIFTDKIGQPFQDKMDELYPPPEQPKAEGDSDEKKDPWGQPIQKLGSISKGRGTIFLVDRQNRTVIWSIYSPVSGSQPNDTNRRASDITKKLQKDLEKEHKEVIPPPHQ